MTRYIAPMPVDTTHVEYDEMFDRWQTIEDVLGGEHQIKAATARYLPLLAEQEDDSYRAYLKRAVFYNATGRTREALLGFIYRKPAEIKVPKSDPLNSFMTDATLTGRSFENLCKDVTEKILGPGRYGTLVDWDPNENRPYASHYNPQDIINWRTERVKGKQVLTMLMLHESASGFTDIGDGNRGGDKYEDRRFDQWREFELIPDGEGNRFLMVSVWRRADNSEGGRKKARLPGTGSAKQARGEEYFVKIATLFPNRRGIRPLDFIPFVFHGPEGPKIEVVRPPLEDMALINVSHYRTSADLENARHVLGMPTPWAAGFTDKESDELYLGSSTAWTTSEPTAKCGFLALKSEDLKGLTDGLTEKQQQMATLGASMLEKAENENGPEAFATVALRQSGKSAVLTRITIGASESLTDVLALADWWQRSGDATPEDCEAEANVTLNKDFMGLRLDSQTVASLMSMFMQGAISFETLFWNLQQGELIEPGVTLEQEKQRIIDTQMMLLGNVEAKTPPDKKPGE
jgi:hypothetical protein